jgi:H+/gluconate symporter-like permease
MSAVARPREQDRARKEFAMSDTTAYVQRLLIILACGAIFGAMISINGKLREIRDRLPVPVSQVE